MKSYFDFKQFRVYHDRCAMKVGTDSVLLGAWVDVDGDARILDAGCGSGLLALMVAQRCAALVTGVELDPAAARQAAENVAASPFAARVSIVCANLLTYCPAEAFDSIVCNPPYFLEATRSPDIRRATARHADSLNATTIAATAHRLLGNNGRLHLVLPTSLVFAFQAQLTPMGFSLIRRTDVLTKPATPPKRTLLTFVKETQGGRPSLPPLRTDTLTLFTTDGQRTEAYEQLVRDFYL